MAFSPEYVRTVLNDNFEDAKRLFLEPLVAILHAHVVMLAEEGIVGAADARAVRDALDHIDFADVRRAVYDGTCEDLFFYIDRAVAATCGRDVAGRVHVARSRNDVDMTMYRMRVRDGVLTFAESVLALGRALVDIAARHRESVFPAHTHGQPAQPTTLAHYLLAVIEELDRDVVRLIAAEGRVNRCPLGACAITGTGFPIRRERTSALLGFSAPTGNTYGSIASVDYLLESAAAVSVTLVGVGRFVQDLLLWSTREFGYLRLSDAFVQVSSIMPQKRNPVALEHARALASKAWAEAMAIAAAVHNTPFGDIVDTEDDLQPLVAAAFRDAARAVTLVSAAIAGADFDTARMRTRAAEGWITVTELADTLTREHGLAFQSAHAIASSFVTQLDREPGADRLAALTAIAQANAHELHLSAAELDRALDPIHFVSIRRTPGGPAPEVTLAAIDAAREAWDAHAGALDRERTRIADGARLLDAAKARI